MSGSYNRPSSGEGGIGVFTPPLNFEIPHFTPLMGKYVHHSKINPTCNAYSGKDSCQGDSGGPLIGASKYTGDEPRYSWLGIVSFGVGCAEVGCSIARNLRGLTQRILGVKTMDDKFEYITNDM